jgi:AMMECR1 domain-containing protein
MVDPRLPAVVAAEWPELDVSVSVLSRPEPLPFTGGGLAAALRPGVDGLIITDGTRRATFLPAVWHKVTDPGRFVAALLAKGGWSAGDLGELAALRYTATEFTSAAPRPPLAADPGAVSPGDAA